MEKEKWQLDKLDRQILYWMDIDCRQSLTSLSKKLHASPARLAYRLEQLVKNKAILSFITIVDYRKIKYRPYAVYYKLKEMPEDKRAKMINEICKIPRVTDVLLTYGTYDLQVVLLVKSTDDAAESLWLMREAVEGYAIDEIRLIHLKAHFFTHENFIDSDIKKTLKPKVILDTYKGEVEVDEIDKKILMVLADNANWPIWKVAKQTGIGGPTVYSRMKKLEKKGIIAGYSTKLNPNLDGFLHYRVFVKLKYIPQKRRDELMRYLDTQPTIYRSSFTFGNFDMYYDVRLADGTQLKELLKEVYSHFSEEVIRQDWIRVTDIIKFGFYSND
ncbi:MAG: AsnC family transcriptional regulator [Candidatus Micrarchaeia archaeon]